MALRHPRTERQCLVVLENLRLTHLLVVEKAGASLACCVNGRGRSFAITRRSRKMRNVKTCMENTNRKIRSGMNLEAVEKSCSLYYPLSQGCAGNVREGRWRGPGGRNNGRLHHAVMRRRRRACEPTMREESDGETAGPPGSLRTRCIVARCRRRRPAGTLPNGVAGGSYGARLSAPSPPPRMPRGCPGAQRAAA